MAKSNRKVGSKMSNSQKSTESGTTKMAVTNPVDIAVKIVRTSEYKGKSRKVTNYEPFGIAPADKAAEIVLGLNKTPLSKPDSKTTRSYVVMPSEGPGAVLVITDPDIFIKLAARQAKRDAIKSIPATARMMLGASIPAPDADDATLDAWNPTAVPAPAAAE